MCDGHRGYGSDCSTDCNLYREIIMHATMHYVKELDFNIDTVYSCEYRVFNSGWRSALDPSYG